ncbi:MAG: GNAT family N-acetyltransferase [Saprospiraceae bacterium]|nr:GNAT family N-acetyltransferase [Saprospiraceae bacterium]
MRQYKIFETERLWIKPTQLEDASFILELLNTPAWIENIGDRNIRTLEDARIYILNKMQKQLERLGFSNYTIIRKTDNVKLGICGLYDREGLNDIDLGFAILPEFERKGYSFEAAMRLKDAAFKDFGLNTLAAITTKNNVSSQNLLTKLGFKLEGITQLHKDDEELLLYKLAK